MLMKLGEAALIGRYPALRGERIVTLKGIEIRGKTRKVLINKIGVDCGEVSRQNIGSKPHSGTGSQHVAGYTALSEGVCQKLLVKAIIGCER